MSTPTLKNDDDPRMVDIIQHAANDIPHAPTDKLSMLILGYPSDLGVRINGGRVGAAGGPQAFRRLFGRLCASDSLLGLRFAHGSVVDGGDIDTSGEEIDKMHDLLTQRVLCGLRAQYHPVMVVGGGNDQSYGNGRAFLQHFGSRTGQKVMVINIDAHLDVRPLKQGRAHSGSPFRQLLEDPLWNGGEFVEFGAQPSQCSLAHVAYARQRGRVMFLPELEGRVVHAFEELLKQAEREERVVFVSFDIDAIQSSDCPGVSCASPLGLTAKEAMAITRLCGRHACVKMMDFSEYNPQVDEYRTGRLVGMMMREVVLGMHERMKQ